MKFQPIKIGVIGAGANTRKMHLPLLKAMPGVTITDIANRTLESGEKAAQSFDIPNVHSDWREIAESDSIDAVVIGTWPDLHSPATCMSLAHNKHVLCEARMAMNREQAGEMLSASQKYPHLIAQLVPAPFTLKADDVAAEIISSGRLGRISHIQTEFQTAPLCKEGEPLHWRRKKIYSGDNVMALGIIYETLLRWLPPAIWVSAQAKCFNDRARTADASAFVQVEVPDYLNVQFQLENGVQGTMLFSELNPFAPAPRIDIIGSEGALRLELLPSVKLFTAFNKEGIWNEIPLPDAGKNRWRVEEEFINSIRGLETPRLTDFETGLEYMKFTSAVNQSFHNEGRRTPVQQQSKFEGISYD